MIKHFIPRLLNRIKLLDILVIYHPIIINNKKIKIPIIKKLGFGNWGNEELWMNNLLMKLFSLEQFNQFIDIGTNIGQTLLKVKTLEPEISYIGIEPSSTCVYYLNELVKINTFNKVTIINLALGSTENLSFLYGYSYEDSRATLRDNYIPQDKIVMKSLTAVYRFDTLLDHLKIEDKFILKIDVEGEELNVILGAINSINKYHPPIICEILPHNNLMTEIQRQKQLLNELKKINYKVYAIKSTGFCQSADPLENIDDISKSNYLFIHSELEPKYHNSVIL